MYSKAEILSQIDDVFSDETFKDAKARYKYLAEMPDYDTYLQRKKKVDATREHRDFPDWMRPCYSEPLLTAAQELHLFRKFNLFKWLALKKLSYNKLEMAHNDLKEAIEVQKILILCNTRLIANIVKKLKCDIQDKEDVFCDLCAKIYKVVNKFDWRRGIKFSTYATWSLRRLAVESCASLRGGVGRSKTKKKEMQADDGLIDALAAKEHEEDPKIALRGLTKLMLKIADPRQMEVIERHYGLNGYGGEATLQEIGDIMMISKERVRQIEKRGMLAIQHGLLSTHAQLRKKIEEIIFS